ncbi:MAG: hypothetical protein ACI8WB_001499 [Phenylobacterium sp.]|jgi:hypothetical protein
MFKIQTPFRLLSGAILMSTMVGCSNLATMFQQESYEQSSAGSGAIFHKKAFTELNLCNTMVQFDLAQVINVNDDNFPALEIELNSDLTYLTGDETPPKQLCKFISGLEESITKKAIKAPEQQKEAKSSLKSPSVVASRNNFVSYIMALSEQKCSEYKKFLVRDKQKIGTLFGSLTTLFAGTSAILTHAHTAKVFAAASGVSSGINSVYDQERFAALAMEVITAGIDTRRTAIANETKGKFKTGLMEYPISAALADAMRFHGACSAVTGFEVAKESINRFHNPGVLPFNEVLKKLGVELKVGLVNTAPKELTKDTETPK